MSDRIAKTWDEVADHLEAGGLTKSKSSIEEDWVDCLYNTTSANYIRTRHGTPGHKRVGQVPFGRR